MLDDLINSIYPEVYVMPEVKLKTKGTYLVNNLD